MGDAASLEIKRRYIRQTMLEDFGEDGQKQLACARVLVIGAGGLGAPMLSYLTAAGIGTIGLIDPDRVEISNLPRQILYEEADIGRLKTDAAYDRLSELNSHTTICTYPHAIGEENAASIIQNYDIIADGCDDYSTRFIVNAACIALKKPLVSASVIGWNGQLASFDARHKTSPCYGCFVHQHAQNANICATSGVVGAVAGVIGTMQALEVIRLLLSRPALLGKLMLFDGLTHAQRILHLPKDPACPYCKN